MNHTAYIPGKECHSSMNKKCCKLLPHYSLPATDTEFLLRNIQYSSENGLDIPNHFLSNDYIYPGNLTRDVAMSMATDEFDDWRNQERIRRGDVCPSAKWWNDLNSGRRYYRGISDSMDNTIYERNNFPSGWFNAKCANPITQPGNTVPYRNPYVENQVCGNQPFNPDTAGAQTLPMNNLGTKHYFYSITELEKFPDPFCRCRGAGRPCTDGKGKCYNCNKRYPELYY